MDFFIFFWKVDSEKYMMIDVFFKDVNFITKSVYEYWGERFELNDGR